MGKGPGIFKKITETDVWEAFERLQLRAVGGKAVGRRGRKAVVFGQRRRVGAGTGKLN